jgi:hypothetical protein
MTHNQSNSLGSYTQLTEGERGIIDALWHSHEYSIVSNLNGAFSSSITAPVICRDITKTPFENNSTVSNQFV